MDKIAVEPVTTRRQRTQFLGFPWVLHRGNPNWIPPLRGNQKELVGYRRHPFYRRNEVQTFLAYRSGEVCGRVAAVLNHDHIERFSERRGFFGFFECVDDRRAAHALFDAARQWLAERGVSCLRGPVSPSLNYEVGLLVDGFDSPATFMMSYNPPYYASLLESYGFRKAQDLYAYWGHVDMLPKIAAKLSPIAEQILAHYNARVRPVNTRRFREDVEAFLSIYNRSLEGTWGFVPMTQGEVRHIARSLRYLIVPELAVGVEVDGQLVGAVLGLPDYNPRIQQIDGRLFPFGFLHLLRKKHQIKRIRVLSANVVPEYQRQGLGLVLLNALVPKALEWGIEEAEFSWVLESNSLSRRSLEKGGAIRTKTYRLYDLDT